MKKVIKKIILSLVFLLFLNCMSLITKAKETPIVHYIFDKQEVTSGDTFSLTLVLEKYQDLSTVQFVCNVEEDIFSPIVKDNKYFLEPTFSLFEENEIYENNYIVEENILRFVGITKGGKTYGHSSLNQVFTIHFRANKNISRVEEYFYETDNNKGSRTILIDKWAKELSADNRYSEILKTTWEKEKYEVEVFDILPDVRSDIMVLNRNSSEYKMEIVSDEIDMTKIGSQVIKVKIYDYVTSQVLYLARSIMVIDKTSPTIEVIQEEVTIDDISIDTSNFDFFVSKDNYDAKPILNCKYYNDKEQEIVSLSEFKKYLKNNLEGKISCYAVDSSNNQSRTVSVNIKINDTTSPLLKKIDDLVVIDQELASFNLESLIEVSDNYTKYPTIKYRVIDNNNIEYQDYLTALKEVYNIMVEYYAIDEAGNESEKYQLKISLKDTISPILKNVLDKEILDEHLNYYLQDHHLLEKDFIITDNFTKKVTLSVVYYCKEQIVTEEEFFDNLQKGLSGKIEYQAIDSYGNQSEKIIQNVKVLDDTAPIITINNLKDKEKYLGPITIDYVVTDNLKGLVNVEVLVNGNVYSGEELIDLNQYNLMIVVTDEKGNKSIKEITFEIVEENFFGCIDGFDCAENNYAVGIIIGIGLVLIVGVVVTIEIIYVKKKKDEMRIEE